MGQNIVMPLSGDEGALVYHDLSGRSVGLLHNIILLCSIELCYASIGLFHHELLLELEVSNLGIFKLRSVLV